MAEAERGLEHLSKVEQAYRGITAALWDLAAKFGADSEEEKLVRRAEVEDWDLASRKTLYSELMARYGRRNKSQGK